MMNHPTAFRLFRLSRRSPAVAGLMATVLLAITFALLPPPTTNAQTDIKVTVTIHKVSQRGCYGDNTFLGCVGGEDADFYSVVTLGGERTETGQIEDESSIEPNWQFRKSFPKDSRVPITIEMWDSDGFLRGDDDHVDLTGAGGENLDLTLVLGTDPGSCRVEGNFAAKSAPCGDRITDTGGNDDESAFVEFSVSVVYPTKVGKLSVRCTHSPLWPQPGQPITITGIPVQIESGTFNTPTPDPALPPVFGGLNLPHLLQIKDIVADRVQLWFNPNGLAAGRTRVQDCLKPAAATGCVAVVTPTGTSFQYGCWVDNAGTSVASNFRAVTVGQPLGANVTPVLFNGPQEKSVDVVLHPDSGYAGGWTNPQFIADAGTMVNLATNEPTWYQYQQRLNVWISPRLGSPTWPVSGTGSTTNSTIVLADGNGPETFADASGIVHRQTITDAAGVVYPTRDAAGGGMFTINALVASSPNVMRHEMGHAVFGLADEYCCDGGYFQQTTFPDVYSSNPNCVGDLGGLAAINTEFLWPAPGPCRSFNQATPVPPTSTPGPPPTAIPPGQPTLTPAPTSTPITWWLSDPAQFNSGGTALNDLMSGNDYGTTTDIRRMRWTFDQLCVNGDC